MALVRKSVSGATGTVTGTVVEFDTPKNSVTMQRVISGFSSATIDVYVSVDGVNFTFLFNPSQDLQIANPPYAAMFYRADVSAVVGGPGTVDVSFSATAD